MISFATRFGDSPPCSIRRGGAGILRVFPIVDQEANGYQRFPGAEARHSKLISVPRRLVVSRTRMGHVDGTVEG